jgi:CHAT domain-containing protein
VDGDAYPDACALILAAAPGCPERELLPYRRIAGLPLTGVELVVLSACSSLVGRSDRSASMEGLAWAFLRAGVPQVIASRYPVDDRATAELMLTLYGQLETLPVADALGRTRDICLTNAEVPPGEVAAWSVWC